MVVNLIILVLLGAAAALLDEPDGDGKEGGEEEGFKHDVGWARLFAGLLALSLWGAASVMEVEVEVVDGVVVVRTLEAVQE